MNSQANTARRGTRWWLKAGVTLVASFCVLDSLILPMFGLRVFSWSRPAEKHTSTVPVQDTIQGQRNDNEQLNPRSSRLASDSQLPSQPNEAARHEPPEWREAPLSETLAQQLWREIGKVGVHLKDIDEGDPMGRRRTRKELSSEEISKLVTQCTSLAKSLKELAKEVQLLELITRQIKDKRCLMSKQIEANPELAKALVSLWSEHIERVTIPESSSTWSAIHRIDEISEHVLSNAVDEGDIEDCEAIHEYCDILPKLIRVKLRGFAKVERELQASSSLSIAGINFEAPYSSASHIANLVAPLPNNSLINPRSELDRGIHGQVFLIIALKRNSDRKHDIADAIVWKNFDSVRQRDSFLRKHNDKAFAYIHKPVSRGLGPLRGVDFEILLAFLRDAYVFTN